MSILMMNNSAYNALEIQYGKLHFKASNSAENLNIVVNTGSNLPSSKLLSVWINGQITDQLYNSITFNAGDIVQIRLIPHPNPNLSTHFGNIYVYMPEFSFTGKNVLSEIYELPLMMTKLNTPVTRVPDTFNGNTSLTYVPADIFSRHNKYNLTDIIYTTGDNNGTFYKCTSLTSIPETIFKDLPNIRYFGDIRSNFYGGVFKLSGLTEIPAELLKYNTTAVNTQYMFYGCTGLTEIPNHLLDTLTELTSVGSMFAGCTGITSIPTDFLKYNTKLTNASSLFNNTRITEIPAELLKYNTKLTSVGSMFRSCPITSVPDHLLDTLTELTSAQSLFVATKISSVSEDLFKYNTKLLYVTGMFYNCAISSIPEKLFWNCPDIVEVSGTDGLFEACTNITEIPELLFKYTTKITSLNIAFWNNRITNIPEKIFETCVNITSFRGVFGYNKITTIPELLFKTNINATSFESSFRGCSNLLSIPSNLFLYNTAATSFLYTFQDCTSLGDFELYIGSEVVTNATNFCSLKSGTTRIIHVKAGSTTETTFNNIATSCGLTIISDI